MLIRMELAQPGPQILSGNFVVSFGSYISTISLGLFFIIVYLTLTGKQSIQTEQSTLKACLLA